MVSGPSVAPSLLASARGEHEIPDRRARTRASSITRHTRALRSELALGAAVASCPKKDAVRHHARTRTTSITPAAFRSELAAGAAVASCEAGRKTAATCLVRELES